MCWQAVQSSLLQTLKETAERLGQNRSLLLIGPSGCGKTLVGALHELACSRTIGQVDVAVLCDACAVVSISHMPSGVSNVGTCQFCVGMCEGRCPEGTGTGKP